jgi:predicted component of type VI protein secretion system
MPARLVPLSPGTAPSIAMQRQVLLIGRHPESDLRLESPQISERHCCLAQANGKLVLLDLGSRNGVRVNGRLITEAPLRVGDEVAIAHLLYRVAEITDANGSNTAAGSAANSAGKPVSSPAKPAAKPQPQPRPEAKPQPAKSVAVKADEDPPSSLSDLPFEFGDTDLVPIDDI